MDWHESESGLYQQKDCSSRPGVTYDFSRNGERVLDGQGKWHSSPRAYVAARINAVDSSLPQAEKDNVIGFVWDIVSAQHTSLTSMSDLVGLYTQRRSKQPLPAAMKAAYKKYGLATPEMAAEGITVPCAQCGKLELPGERYKLCACRAEGMKYCGADCQRAHWKAGHKSSCSYRKSWSSSGEGAVAAVATAVAGVSLSRTAGTDTSTARRGGSGVGRSGERGKKHPSKAAIDRMTEQIIGGDPFDPDLDAKAGSAISPIPGSEDFEAWKVVVQSMRKACVLQSQREVLDHMIEQTVKGEADYWREYPNHPNWALGTGPSRQEDMQEAIEALYEE